jgi:hypothetical protein
MAALVVVGKMSSNTVTAAALTDMVRISPRSITDLAKRGIITRQGRGFALTESVRS